MKLKNELYCVACANLHSSECYASRDSENDCSCPCNSGLSNLKGKTPKTIKRMLAQQAVRNAAS